MKGVVLLLAALPFAFAAFLPFLWQFSALPDQSEAGLNRLAWICALPAAGAAAVSALATHQPAQAAVAGIGGLLCALALRALSPQSRHEGAGAQAALIYLGAWMASGLEPGSIIGGLIVAGAGLMTPRLLAALADRSSLAEAARPAPDPMLAALDGASAVPAASGSSPSPSPPSPSVSAAEDRGGRPAGSGLADLIAAPAAGAAAEPPAPAREFRRRRGPAEPPADFSGRPLPSPPPAAGRYAHRRRGA